MSSQGGGTVITDTPFGDTGKGGTVDRLSEDERYVAGVRWQGGGNSGHSVPFGDKIVDVHRLPSTLVRSAERPIMSVMGQGVVFSLPGLNEEMNHVRSFGIKVSPENLLISSKARLTLPYHRALEGAREDSSDKSGTTRQAIAQTYGFDAMYEGVLLGDITDKDYLARRLKKPLGFANAILSGYYNKPTVHLDEVMAEIEQYREAILPFMGDESEYLNRLLEQGKWVLFEGAQSSMLCRSLGWYPHITGSNTWPGSIQAGCGVHYSWIRNHYLVMKAYDTSVGNRPLIARMPEDLEQLIQKRGHEVGVTSGRPRQCLWHDSVIDKYVSQIGRPTHLVINKGDVLTGIHPINLCVAYELDGRRIEHMPSSAIELSRCKPILEAYDGWNEDFTGATKWSELPTQYKAFLGALVRPFHTAKISMVGTGRFRHQVVIV